jgi:hypothetical protein
MVTRQNVKTACAMNMTLIWLSLLPEPEQMLCAFIKPNGLQKDSTLVGSFIREAYLSVQDDLEADVEFLPRPRQRGALLNHSQLALWLRPRLAIMDLFSVGVNNVAPTTPNDRDYEMYLDTQAEILKSDTLALQTIEALHLDKNVHFLQGTMQKGASQRELVSRFRSGLKVSRVAHSNVIQIQYSSTDPRLSLVIVNALVHNYVDYNFQTRYNSKRLSSKQLMDLRPKVDGPYPSPTWTNIASLLGR